MDPLNIIYDYPSWISSTNRDLQNYHFTLLAVIFSTPLSLVNKLEAMYWRGVNKSHWFIQKSHDSIWTLGQFIYSHSNEQSMRWYTLHFINLVLEFHIYENFTKLLMSSSQLSTSPIGPIQNHTVSPNSDFLKWEYVSYEMTCLILGFW